MNATEILGDLMRGGGGSILKDMLGGRRAPSPKPQRTSPPDPHAKRSPDDYEQQIRELEESFGVGASSSQPSQSAPSRPTNWNPSPADHLPPPLPRRAPDGGTAPERQDAESLILIRAMINAAKADGRLTRDEQSAILKQYGERSREATRFLEQEINSHQSVRDFVWSIPVGLEYKVYAISLAAIDLDSKSESSYLAELAHGLRLPMEVRSHLHQRYGAPLPA